MKSIHHWLEEYGRDHRHPTNKRIHWICVPLIVWSIIALLWQAPFPYSGRVLGLPVNWAVVAFILSTTYYLVLSWQLALCLIVFNLILLWGCAWLEQLLPWPLHWCALAVFVAAWIGQFIGHKIEGRKPAFFTDLQFLLIGPAWLTGYIYRQLGWRF